MYYDSIKVVMALFDKIRALREDNDLTQEKISQILSCSQRAYSHYENGTRQIPIEALIKLADYYNVSLDYLVGRSKNKK